MFIDFSVRQYLGIPAAVNLRRLLRSAVQSKDGSVCCGHPGCHQQSSECVEAGAQGLQVCWSKDGGPFSGLDA